MWHLGLDPALTGSAILLTPAQVPVVGWTWRPRTRNGARIWEVAIVQPPFARTEYRATLNQVALLIREGCSRVTGQSPFSICYETPFVGKNIRSALSVAQTTGKLLGPLEEGSAQVTGVEPNAWRKGLVPQGKRDTLKETALRVVPVRLPAMGAILTLTAQHFAVPQDSLDHLVDAAGVALFGATQGTHPHDEATCQLSLPTLSKSSTHGAQDNAPPADASSAKSAKSGSKSSSRPTRRAT